MNDRGVLVAKGGSEHSIKDHYLFPVHDISSLCEGAPISKYEKLVDVCFAPPPGMLESEIDGFLPSEKQLMGLKVLDHYLKSSSFQAQPAPSVTAPTKRIMPHAAKILRLDIARATFGRACEDWQRMIEYPHKSRDAAFSRMMDAMESLRASELVQEVHTARLDNLQRSERLALGIKRSCTPPVVERVIVGTGPNATLLYAMIRSTTNKVEAGTDIPPIIAIGRADDQFSRDGSTPLGQNHRLLSLNFFSRVPHDFLNAAQAHRTDTHVRADIFVEAMDVTKFHLQMPCLNDTISGPIEQQALHRDTWHVDECKYRVPSTIASCGYIYTNAVDLCVGLGPPRLLPRAHLSEQHDQLLRQVVTTTGIPRLVYGSDFPFDFHDGVWPRSPAREVVIYGGGARAAKCALYALVKGGCIVHWGAREPDIPTQDPFGLSMVGAWASAVLAKTEHVRQVAALEWIRPYTDERVAVKFQGHPVRVCDLVIIAIGQDANAATGPHMLIRELCPLLPLYQEVDGQHVRGLGCKSADGAVRVLGAAGSTGLGLGAEHRAEFLQLVAHEASWQPSEAQIVPGLFRSEQTMSVVTNSTPFRNINSASPEELQLATGDATFTEWMIAERKRRPFGFASVVQLLHEPAVIENGWKMKRPWLLSPMNSSWE